MKEVVGRLAGLHKKGVPTSQPFALSEAPGPALWWGGGSLSPTSKIFFFFLLLHHTRQLVGFLVP